jgi:hypothetical protein
MHIKEEFWTSRSALIFKVFLDMGGGLSYDWLHGGKVFASLPLGRERSRNDCSHFIIGELAWMDWSKSVFCEWLAASCGGAAGRPRAAHRRAYGGRRKRSRAEDFSFCVHASSCGLGLDRWPQHAASVDCRARVQEIDALRRGTEVGSGEELLGKLYAREGAMPEKG